MPEALVPEVVVPEVGVEPTRPEGRGILSPLRLPFRHSGMEIRAPWGGAAATVAQSSTATVQLPVLELQSPRLQGLRAGGSNQAQIERERLDVLSPLGYNPRPLTVWLSIT